MANILLQNIKRNFIAAAKTREPNVKTKQMKKNAKNLSAVRRTKKLTAMGLNTSAPAHGVKKNKNVKIRRISKKKTVMSNCGIFLV
jgi:hypothetical protein